MLVAFKLPSGLFRLVDPGDVLAVALGSRHDTAEFTNAEIAQRLPSIVKELAELPGSSSTDGLFRLCMDAARFGWWLVCDVTRTPASISSILPTPYYYTAVYMVDPGSSRNTIPRIARHLLYIRTSATAPGLGSVVDQNENERTAIGWLITFATTVGNACHASAVDVTWDANQDLQYTNAGSNYDKLG